MLYLYQSALSVPESTATAEYKAIYRALLKQWRRYKRQVIVLSLWLITANHSALCLGQDLQALPIPEKTGALTISLRGNRLSIQADQVPWQALLAKLELITHLSIHAKPLSSKISLAIPFLPVNEALQQLFNRRFDYVLLYSRLGAQHRGMPEAVWLLNDLSENATHAGLVSEHQANDKLKLGGGYDENTGKSSRHAADSDVEALQDLIAKAKQAESPEIRLHSLARLNGSELADKSTTTHALETALDDDDARIREYALQALAKQDAQAAITHLREALDDTAESVRIKAVESIPLDGQGEALLEAALSHPDEMVKFIAEEKLKQMSH